MDPRFVGHVHALRLTLTDPRFPAAAAPGALTARPEARAALSAALSAVTAEPVAADPGHTADADTAPGHDGATPRPAPAAGSPTTAVADATRPAPTSAPAPKEPSAAQPNGDRASLPNGTAPGAPLTGTSAGRAPEVPGATPAASDAPAPAVASGGPAGPAPCTGRVPVTTGAALLGGTPLPDLVAARLEGDGAAVHRPEFGSLVAAVPDGPQARKETRDAVEAVDDEAVRLRSAVKSRDGFFTTFFISPYSRYLARWCARRGFTPNQVTTASLLTALVAAGCAATGTRGGFVAAGLLLLFSFVLDCTDGQLARYSLQYSTLGAWLDATFDRAKEYAYYAGLAIGAARGADDVWALALGAMVLQTCRHVVDFAFNEANHDATANTSPTAALSDRLDSVGWTVWVRRMIVLPIGERWALIAVLTALTTPRTVFVVLLVGCAFAACYTTAGRVLRSLTRKATRTDRAARALADLADTGPLAELAAKAAARVKTNPLPRPLVALIGAAWLPYAAAEAPLGGPLLAAAALYVLTSGAAVARPLKGPLDWLVPPVFRAAEYGTVLILAARSDAPGALPAAFGLVAAVAYHHYDTVYRIRGGTGAPPAWLVRTLGGHDGRALLVAVLAALLATGGDDSRFTLALTALAGAVALVGLAESIRFWVSSGAPAVHDEGEPA